MKKPNKEETYLINIEENKKLAVKHISQVINVFDSLGIPYWIEYGTLLGAVREGGFIPWDSETDIGVWHVDYKKHKHKLVNHFENCGFTVDASSRDRIKLFHRDLTIGAYKIDIHTYHLKNNVAYVSWNSSLNPNKSLMFFRRAMSFYDRREQILYTIAPMIRYMLENNIDLPEEFLFTKGSCKSHLFFKISINGVTYNTEKKYFEEIGFVKRLTIKTIGFFNKVFHPLLIEALLDILDRKIDKSSSPYAIVQAIPSHYYENLSTIDFESLSVRCPRDYQSYLDTVYGNDWLTPKANWTNAQNQINKEINEIQ